MAAHIRDGVIYEGGSAGGESNLKDLEDVSLNDVQEGQALVYDATNDKWVNGELWFNYGYNGSTFLTREEVLEIIKEYSETYSWITKENYEEVKNSTGSHFDCLVYELTDGEIIAYQNYIYDDYLSKYSEKYTTKSGDKIVAFGKYGYDG